MDAICEQYSRAADAETVDRLLLIPVFIADFLCIHPFNDGNGRMSRLLTTLLLYKGGYVVGRYVSLIEGAKETYYEALREVSGVAYGRKLASAVYPLSAGRRIMRVSGV